MKSMVGLVHPNRCMVFKTSSFDSSVVKNKVLPIVAICFTRISMLLPGIPRTTVVNPWGIPPSSNRSNFSIPVVMTFSLLLLSVIKAINQIYESVFMVVTSVFTRSRSPLSSVDAWALNTSDVVGAPNAMLVFMMSSPLGNALSNMPLRKP